MASNAKPRKPHKRSLWSIKTPVTTGLRDQFDLPLMSMVIAMTNTPSDIGRQLVGDVSMILYIVDLALVDDDKASREALIAVRGGVKSICQIIERGNACGTYGAGKYEALTLAGAIETARREIVRLTVEQLYIAKVKVDALIAMKKAEAV